MKQIGISTVWRASTAVKTFLFYNSFISLKDVSTVCMHDALVVISISSPRAEEDDDTTSHSTEGGNVELLQNRCNFVVDA
jgi:hypothetical protein